MQELYATFWEHVEELRQTLLRSLIIVGIGFLVVLQFYQPILQFLAAFSLNSLGSEELKAFSLDLTKHHTQLLIMGPTEGFALVFKLCFLLSAALTSPLWGWVWLRFFLPALNAQERAVLVPLVVFSFFALSGGVVFAHYATIPASNQLLFAFNASIGQNAWTLTHYVDFILVVYLGHAIAAELSVLLFLLVHIRFLSSDALIAKRKLVIVAAFILAAVLTPPDILTQILMALPLLVLYEAAIWYAKWRQVLILHAHK